MANVFVLLGVVLTCLPLAHAGAQSAPGGNPCAEARTAARIRQSASAARFTLLHDGVAPLRRPPATPVPRQLAASRGCVLLSVALVERGGQFVVQDAGQVATFAVGAAGRGRGAAVAQLTTAATEVVRAVVNQGVFPTLPRATGRYFVAVPLWAEHPLFGSASVASAEAATAAAATAAGAGASAGLRERGWTNTTLLGTANGIEVHLLAQVQHRIWLAVVRDIPIDQPILDVPQVGMRRSSPRYGYGGDTEERFRSTVVPLLPPSRMAAAEIEIWHYARDTRLTRQENSNFDHGNKLHPLTGDARVEVPVGVERWAGNRRDPSAPFVWTAGSVTLGANKPNYNTIRQIQEVQRAYAERAAVSTRVRADRDAREAATRTAWADAARALETLKQREFARAGLVYRDAAYWQQYKMGNELRAVFDGDFPDATREWEFGQIYRRVIRAFSERCRDRIPPGSPALIVSTFEFDASDRATLLDRDTTFVRREFSQPYGWWESKSPRAPAFMPPGIPSDDSPQVLQLLTGFLTNSGNTLSGSLQAAALLTRVGAGLRTDMARLFADGCEGPVLTQLQENMRRLAIGSPSLQAQRTPATIAARPESPATLEEGCQRYIREGGFSVGREWCPCLARVFSARTTVGQRWLLLSDYTRFFRLVDTRPSGGPSDPGWGYYEPANICRR